MDVVDSITQFYISTFDTILSFVDYFGDSVLADTLGIIPGILCYTFFNSINYANITFLIL